MNLRNSRVYTAPVPKMPPGLIELMEGLARDVLKNSLTDVYAFCAEHMHKLLQIRNGSIKKLPTLEQKIAVATKKVQERAAQRRKEFDKNCQLTSTLKDSITIEENYVETGRYNQENIVKIPENALLGNVEHEIVVGVDESLNSKTILSDFKADEIDIPNSENHLKTTTNIEKIESEPTKTEDSENIEENKLITDGNITSNDDLTTEKINLNEENSFLLSTKNEEETCEENVSSEEKVDLCNKLSIRNDPEENFDNDTEINNADIILNKCQNGNEVSSEMLDPNFTIDTNQSNLADIEEKENENNETDETEKYEDVCENKSEFRSHANNNSMDLETAAITIQKVFRSFLFRNKTCSIDDATAVDMNLLIDEKENKENEGMANSNISKDRRGMTRMDTVLQTVNEEKSLSLSTDDSSTLSSAATIIQAHVRGFLVRNKLNLNKTISSTSGIDSDAQSMTSLEGDNDYRKSKTVLNIHIVPEGGHFMSRDESILTSTDLSLDGSPPGSTNLHPLGYDKNVRRKQLKREDAIQSVSPPSNNSGKLSEDVDSVKEMALNGDNEKHIKNGVSTTINTLNDDNIATMINENVENYQNTDADNLLIKPKDQSCLKKMASDEMDVITPFGASEESVTLENNVKLMHSGECHDMVLPTKVSRSDTSIVREFQNVVVYFLLWNNS